MKRMICLLMVLLLCGCTKIEAPTIDNRSFLRPGVVFCSDGETVSFLGNMLLGGNRLQFADLNAEVFGPLCGKPECSHREDTCNAKLSPPVRGLGIYEDKLYWISSQDYVPHIFCANRDGTERRDVRTLEGAALDSITGDQMFCFWRGYLIACGTTFRVRGGQEERGVAALAFSLADPEQDTVLMEKPALPEQYMAARIQPHGENLYGLQTSEQGLLLWRWQPGMTQPESIYNDTPPCVVHSFWVTDEGILLSSETDGTVYALDPGNGEIHPHFAMEDVMRIEFAEGIAVGITRGEDDSILLKTASTDGENMQTIPVPEVAGAILFCGADAKNLYLYCMDMVARQDSVVAVSREDGSSRTIWEGAMNLGTEN